MRILNGTELADFVKERQSRQVRSIRQSKGVSPKLAIIKNGQNPVIDLYIKLKQQYGQDILIDVDIYDVAMDEIASTISKLNQDSSVHGMILQLPIEDPSRTDDFVNMIDPIKDVDGLNQASKFIPATAVAIDWLINGYGISLDNKKIVIVGNGRLVGAPLYKLWKGARYNVVVYDKSTDDLIEKVREADVIISATGSPRLITNEMLKNGAVVVDAGTASEDGLVVGDVDDSIRERQDITITPKKGGVGPLTIAALFDNLLVAAENSAKQ